ncbi:hypothetical protein [Maribacter sp. 2304DJ31-5]|uniref:hypothetical protein n=1 Tax=Maribacter sp. 2304DJ31-5 TaxID=3386273 RepID=UPI0039BCC83C
MANKKNDPRKRRYGHKTFFWSLNNNIARRSTEQQVNEADKKDPHAHVKKL